MKKLTAALTLISLLFLCVTAGINGGAHLEEIELGEFSKEVSRIVSEYENEKSDGRTYRIIVKSQLKVNSLDAKDFVSGYGGLQVFQFDNAASADRALEYYGVLKSVEYVAEDKTVSINDAVEERAVTPASEITSPTKPQADACGLTALKSYINENGITFESQKTVAVIDSGIDSDHEMFSGRLLPSGGNFIGGDSSEDDWGHGTHVAGIIADNTPENIKIKAYKVLNNFGTGTELQTANGVYAAVEDGVDLINLSLVISGDSTVMHDAVKTAYNAGITVIAAAGNNTRDLGTSKYSPACFDECITVMNISTDYTKKASNTNYGAPVDIAAPGIDVYSAYLDGQYKTMSGTSMSTPFVTSAASYILLSGKGQTPEEVRTILKDNRIMAVGECEPGGLWAEYVTRELNENNGVLFSVPEGKFNREFYLELSPENEGAEIYYKTSRMASTAGYVKYTSPIYISATTKVTAFAVKKGCKISEPITNEYTSDFSSTDRYWESDLNGVVTKYKGFSSDVTVPEVIKGVKTTALTAGIFDAAGLNSIVLPDSVTSLPDNMFSGASGITKITANGVENIGAEAFYGCKYLSDVTMPNVKTVNDKAFYGCEALSALSFPDCTDIGSSAFEGCKALKSFDGEKLESANEYAFKNSGLTSIDFPLLKTAGEGSFFGCTSLTAASVPNILSGSDSLFSGCTALKSVSMDKADYIGDSIFSGCVKLNTVNLPNVTAMGSSPFNNCKALKDLELPGLTEIKSGDFNNTAVSGEMYFPKVANVAQNAFDGASAGAVIYESAVTCASYPANTKTALPSTVLEWLSPTSGKVYGGAECKEKAESLDLGESFVQLSPETAVWKDVSSEAIAGRTEVMFGVLGFNREYQWFNSAENAIGGGTPVEGANSKYFTPSTGDEYEYYYCRVTSTDKNGETFVAYSNVLKAHTVTSTEWTVEKEATCTENGTKVKYCDKCGEVAQSTSLSALGHKRSRTATIDSEPTCTKSGSYSYRCVRCDTVMSRFTKAALRHDYSGEYIMEKETTCTEEGVAYIKCSRCDSVKYKYFEKLAHMPDGIEVVIKEATCESTGLKGMHCTVCGGECETVEIPKTPHSFPEKKTVVKAPTCLEEGYEAFVCTVCSLEGEKTVLAALGHDYSDKWTVITKATCKTEGTKAHKCTRCEEYKDETALPTDPDAHTFEITGYGEAHPHYANETCSLCNTARVNKEKTKRNSSCVNCTFQWRPDGSGGIIITKCYAKETTFTVPAVINGFKVTGIGEKAFDGSKFGDVMCDSIIIEEGIESIASKAFYKCYAGAIYIPSTVTSIADDALYQTLYSSKIICRENTAAHKFALKNLINCEVISDIFVIAPSYFSDEHSGVIIASQKSGGDLNKILTANDGTVIYGAPSYKHGETEIFGTGSLISSTVEKYGTAVYKMVIKGDLNGDGVCDVLDAHLAETYLNKKSFGGKYCVGLAATNGMGGEMTVEDYSQLVNTALGGSYDEEVLSAEEIVNMYKAAVEKPTGYSTVEYSRKDYDKDISSNITNSLLQNGVSSYFQGRVSKDGVLKSCEENSSDCEFGRFELSNDNFSKLVSAKAKKTDGGTLVTLVFSGGENESGGYLDALANNVALNGGAIDGIVSSAYMLKSSVKKSENRSVMYSHYEIEAVIGGDGLFKSVRYVTELSVSADVTVMFGNATHNSVSLKRIVECEDIVYKINPNTKTS